MEGIVAPKKGSRRIDALESGEEDVEVDIKEEFVSQLKKQEEFQEVIHEIRDEHKDIETCQEYLRHTVEEVPP